MTPDEKLAWLALSRTENVGPITFHRLVQACGSARKALEALPHLSKRGGRKKPLKAPDPGEIGHEYDALRKIGGDIVTAGESLYPLALSALDDAPPILSVLGDASLMNRPCVAMVGARNASLNGRRMAEKLARDLGARGQTIVSGLARGIDTAAHQGALESGTVAVVAGGIDVVYPEENLDLYEKIRDVGLIVAESPLGQKPFAQSFPRRNRIVSGLSQGVIVVEATMRSGSLITARLAGEQGRDVMAVPGSPLDPRAEGPNHLIREGAVLVRSAVDALEALNSYAGRSLRNSAPAELENFCETFMSEEPPAEACDALLMHMSFHPVSVDELIRACHLTVPVVQTVLLELELAGRVRRYPGNRVSLLQE